MDSHYQLITKHRMVLFGISLIWIFLRHTYYYNNYSYSLFDLLVQIGDCGVDVFLFLSGFGLFFSYERSTDIYQFYKKRVIRIIPTVLLLLLTFKTTVIVIRNDSLFGLFSYRWWFNALYCKYWFIGCILFFYAAYPLVYKAIKNNVWIVMTLSFAGGFLGVALVSFLQIGSLMQLVVYFARIPVFVFGAVFAYRQDFFAKKLLLLFCAVGSMPLLYILPKDFQRIFYCFIAVGIVTFLPSLLQCLPRLINKFFAYIGKVSLEFYLIHIFLFSYGALSIIDTYVSIYWSASIILIFVIILSGLSNRVVDVITKRIIGL